MNFGFNTCAKVVLVAGAALFLSFGSAQAGLIGSSMNAKHIANNAPGGPQDIRGERTFTIAADLGLVDLGAGVHMTFSDTQITLIINTGGEPFETDPNRFLSVFLTLLTGPEFTDVTVDPSSTPEFADAPFEFDADGLTVNIAAACAAPGCPDQSKLILNIATAVPEPASLAILGAALAGLTGLRRRRKR